MKKLIQKIKKAYWKFIRTQFAKQYPVYSFSEPYFKRIKKGNLRYKFLVTTFFKNGKPEDIDILISRHDQILNDSFTFQS